MDVALLPEEAGEMRFVVSVQGIWISHTSAAAAPEKARNANTMIQRMIRLLSALCETRIGT